MIQSIEEKERTEKAPALYDLTTLQRDANRILGFTAQQTLDYTQSLYEKKLVTYNMNVSLRVVNTRTYTLPKTGSSGLRLFPVFTLIPTFTCSSGLALSILRKRRS